MDTDGHELIRDIREIISQARSLTRRSVNSLQVISNYLVGMRIVLEEQGGHERAEYGKETMKLLAEELTEEFGRGYSRRNIELMRKFYTRRPEATTKYGTGRLVRINTPITSKGDGMTDTYSLMRKRDRLVRQIGDHLDFLIGSVSTKGS